jgi:starch synthase
MKITFIASEANPFVKTGGLADVVYSLGEQYVLDKHEVNIIIPFYSKIKNSIFINLDYLGSFRMMLGWKEVEVKLCSGKYHGITYYFVENDTYFARGQIYGEGDDGERFAFFTMACIEVIKRYSIKSDIIHLHDWQVGMFPCVVKENNDQYFKKTKFVYTIHNPAFQGIYGIDFISSYYGISRECFDNGTIEMFGQVSTLKAGIMYCDKITTVSPTHREELLTREGSMNLDFALSIRRDDFVGILNGIDNQEFSPEHDKHLVATYNSSNFYDNKMLDKEALLSRFGLKNLGLPVFGLVSRLTWQKGIDLIYPLVRT